MSWPSGLWHRPYVRPHTRFQVTTADGIRLSGVHIRNGHDILIIYCHGFLGNKNHTVVPRFVELLADEADVIAFDFRGHGESEGETTLGDREVLDLAAVMDYARGFDYRRIWLVGSSMGGAVAIRYAAATPDIAGIATIGAFAEPRFSRVSRLSLKLLEHGIARRAVRVARGCRVESVANRPTGLDVVRQISPRPALFIHGEFDPLIPVRHAKALYDYAGYPKKLMIVRRGDHDLPNLNERTRDSIVDWIRTNDSG